MASRSFETTTNGVVPGLGLGAVGLALKMVVVGAISVYLLGFAIERRLRAPHDWRHQAMTLGLFLALGFGCRLAIRAQFRVSATGHDVLPAAIGAVVYAAISAALLFRSPALAGLTSGQAAEIVRTYRQIIGIDSPSHG